MNPFKHTLMTNITVRIRGKNLTEGNSVISRQCTFFVFQLVSLLKGILNKPVSLRRCGTTNWQE